MQVSKNIPKKNIISYDYCKDSSKQLEFLVSKKEYALNVYTSYDDFIKELHNINSKTIVLLLLQSEQDFAIVKKTIEIVKKLRQPINLQVFLKNFELTNLHKILNLEIDDIYCNKINSNRFLQEIEKFFVNKSFKNHIQLNENVSYDYFKSELYLKNKKIELNDSEKKLLILLYKKRESFVDNNTIEIELFEDYFGIDNTNKLRLLISRLNKKCGDSKIIKSEYRKGYKLITG